MRHCGISGGCGGGRGPRWRLWGWGLRCGAGCCGGGSGGRGGGGGGRGGGGGAPAARGPRGPPRGWAKLDLLQMLLTSKRDMHQPDWNKSRELVDVLSLAAQRAIDRGDDEAFVDALADLRTLYVTLAHEPSAVSDLMSGSYEATAT